MQQYASVGTMALWVFLALLAAVADGIKTIFQRFVLKTENVAGYAFVENLISALLFAVAASFS